ncbi:MAG: hypothetical protein AB8G05_12225 [Oligoflexales bacterium]
MERLPSKIRYMKPLYWGAGVWILAFAADQLSIHSIDSFSIGPFYEKDDCLDVLKKIEKLKEKSLYVKYSTNGKINWGQGKHWDLKI